MAQDPTDSHGNLFPIFLLALIQCFLAPITLVRVGGWILDAWYGDDKNKSKAAAAVGAVALPTDASSEWGKAAAAHAARHRPTALRRLQGLFRGFNLYLAVFWGVSAVLVAYICLAGGEVVKVFDPYQVLNVPVGADASTVKKAYLRLSLQYHPDKNPDPDATKFWTESITPAYKALSDDVARENYEKYGHPDGKQAVKLGIALPSWMFGKDGTGPLVLVSLVAFGVLLPLGFAVCTILRMNQYTGSGGVLQQTQRNFFYDFKPSMALSKVPHMLSIAMEYAAIPYSATLQDEPMRKLRALLKAEYTDVKKDPKFARRKEQHVKAHMLILAQACRKTREVDPALQPDLKPVLSLVPRLFELALKVSLTPANQLGYTYMRPTLSLLEFSQCFTQAVAPSVRKPAATSEKAVALGEGIASLLQLPHVDERVATNLLRKKCGSVGDLMAMCGGSARVEALKAAGLSDGAAADVEAHLRFVPRAEVFTASVETEGEGVMAELDVVTCTVNLKMSRGGLPARTLAIAGAAVGEGGGESVGAEGAAAAPGSWGSDNCGLVVAGKDDLPPLPFCTHCEREEGWWLLVTDPASNFTLAHRTLDAKAIEEAQRNPRGKSFELKFNVPTAGTYSLSVLLVSDYWIGVDAKWACKVKVLKRTKEIMEARVAAEKKTGKSAAAAAVGAAAGTGATTSCKKSGGTSTGGTDVSGSGGSDDGSGGGSDGSGSDSDSNDSGEGDNGQGDNDYPSDETGTEESSDEEEEYLANRKKNVTPAPTVTASVKPQAVLLGTAKGAPAPAPQTTAGTADKKPAAPAGSST